MLKVASAVAGAWLQAVSTAQIDSGAACDMITRLMQLAYIASQPSESRRSVVLGIALPLMMRTEQVRESRDFV